MQCPNCKVACDAELIAGVKYINCPDCGWFVKDGDTWTSCEEPKGPQPESESDNPQPSSSGLLSGTGGPSSHEAADSLSINQGNDDDDKDGIVAEITFGDE
ncbi:MAG: hypothetical protein A2167_05505 [Planctomycetes bacterium RBG_13_46_10]|nr:MAG: hypothetical protein A2167_05505 [Planctomycetes bacterium RBG_13_46_10]